MRHLAAALDVQYAFVSEITPDRQAFRTLALWGRGAFHDNLTVPLAGTPCEAVLNGEMSHHPENLQALFPLDTALVDWGAVSYCGVPLLDRSGVVTGHLAIVDDKPMRDGPRGVAIMRIFAARARAEIERARTDAALRASEARLSAILATALDAIIVVDEDGQIALINPSGERMFRCAAADVIATPITRFGTPDAARWLTQAVEDLRTGRKMFRFSAPGLKCRRLDGEEFEFEAALSSAQLGGRQLYHVYMRDLGERRRLEADQQRLELQTAYLQEEIKAAHNFEEIVGQSPVLAEALRKVDLVATTNSSVLILGETGTGKELIARAIHSRSPRSVRPLIKVNCAALPSGLVESELFGHERGAFTGATERRVGRFELADGGTIFLDEVGELPPDVQVKLLRVLQEQEFERVGGAKTIRVDVRVIAATNRDLTQAVAAGTFRQDLYYRLNVFPIQVPPLRDRTDDIPFLVHYFVDRYAAKIGRKITRVAETTLRRLAAYAWPGNVRELENVVERAIILSSGPELEVSPDVLPVLAPPLASTGTPAPDAVSLRDVQREHIVSVLRRTAWRIDGPQGAAQILNLHPNTLRSRMKKLGIQRSAADES